MSQFWGKGLCKKGLYKTWYRYRKGFSVIELLILVVVVGILSQQVVVVITDKSAREKFTMAEHTLDIFQKGFQNLLNDPVYGGNELKKCLPTTHGKNFVFTDIANMFNSATTTNCSLFSDKTGLTNQMLRNLLKRTYLKYLTKDFSSEKTPWDDSYQLGAHIDPDTGEGMAFIFAPCNLRNSSKTNGAQPAAQSWEVIVPDDTGTIQTVPLSYGGDQCAAEAIDSGRNIAINPHKKNIPILRVLFSTSIGVYQ